MQSMRGQSGMGVQCGQGNAGGGPGHLAGVQGHFQSPAPVLGLEASKCVYKLLKVESQFPAALQYDILDFKPAKGLNFLMSGSRVAAPNTRCGPFVREDSVTKPSSSESLGRAVGPDKNCFSFLHPYQILWFFICRFACR